jgi:hypothetical protein
MKFAKLVVWFLVATIFIIIIAISIDKPVDTMLFFPKEDQVYENLLTEERIKIYRVVGDTVFYSKAQGWSSYKMTKERLKDDYMRVK